MRKVDLSMEELSKYEIIKKLVETDGNKNTAAIKIGCTVRNINRLINGYIEKGKAFFIHGNKGHKPKHTLSDDNKNLIIDLYKNKYYEANFTHYTELLEEYEGIKLSESSIRNILMNENILSPKATKFTRKKYKKILEKKQNENNLSKEEKIQIAKSIIDLENVHPRRPRCAYFGELIQMDASTHEWFIGYKSYLHIAVDDATGTIVGAYFDQQETLNGYYNVLNQILTTHGIPYKFLTDRRTVFEYKKKKNPIIEDDSHTQFGYACQQLGIEIQCSSIAQAKGRVERMFETLQSRLPLELRLAGVTSIAAANEFLNSYIKKFNAKFALPIDHNKSVFEKQPSQEKIYLTLSVISERKIDAGHCIRYDKKYYKTINQDNCPIYHRKGTTVLVIKSFDNQLYATVDDIVYGLKEVPVRSAISKNFDILTKKSKPHKIYIPPMSHPWKLDSFKKFIQKQSHIKSKSA